MTRILTNLLVLLGIVTIIISIVVETLWAVDAFGFNAVHTGFLVTIVIIDLVVLYNIIDHFINPKR